MELALLSQGSILWATSNAKFNKQVCQVCELQHQPMGNLDVVWQCWLPISFLHRLLDAWSQLVVIHSCTELIFTIPGIMKIQTIHSAPSNWQFIAISFPHEPFKDNNIITIVLLMFNIRGEKKEDRIWHPARYYISAKQHGVTSHSVITKKLQITH